MTLRSAGLLLHRMRAGSREVLLVHPGGPFWARRDAGAWSIPKGECLEGEDALVAARREFEEETGSQAPSGKALPLGEARQPSRKVVIAYALAGELDPAGLRSNTFDLEWPPRSGRIVAFPEVDRAEWFGPDEARRRILPGQSVFLDRLDAALDGSG